MKIGILSDSHGRADRISTAIGLLVDNGAELLLHLGDIIDCESIDAMSGHPSRIVLGNCDWDESGLRGHANRVGVVCDHPIGRLDVDGRTLAFTHGHRNELMQVALADRVDWLLHGHTHEVRDERIDGTRVINPGALQRAARYTVGLLNTSDDSLAILELPKSAAGVHTSSRSRT